jgi:hypothetical protein
MRNRAMSFTNDAAEIRRVGMTFYILRNPHAGEACGFAVRREPLGWLTFNLKDYFLLRKSSSGLTLSM